jgi:hypothetical protein
MKPILLLLCLPILQACAAGAASDDATETAPSQSLSSRAALARTLAVIEELSTGGDEIRLRRADAGLQALGGGRDPHLRIRLDLDFLSVDELAASRLKDRFVGALQESGACGPIAASSSKALDSGRGVSCDSFQLEFPGLERVTEARTRHTGESRIRSSAVQEDLHIGQVDINLRRTQTDEGAWMDYMVRPAQKSATYSLARVLGFAESLEQGLDPLAVVEIRLRPHDRTPPGGGAVQAWTFELDARSRDA